MISYEQLQEWSRALKSGKYKQTIGILKTSRIPHQYCCLGVLREVCEIPPSRGNERSYSAITDFIGTYGYFTEMNDGLDMSFPEIAEKIDLMIALTSPGDRIKIITSNDEDYSMEIYRNGILFKVEQIS